MNTLMIQNALEVEELSFAEMNEVEGGWEFAQRLGYACGHLVGCATNAAGKLGELMSDALLTKVATKGKL